MLDFYEGQNSEIIEFERNKRGAKIWFITFFATLNQWSPQDSNSKDYGPSKTERLVQQIQKIQRQL